MNQKISITLLVILILVLLARPIDGGVTYPYPSSLILENGEKGLFKFQVQTTDPGIINCKYEIENKEEFPLELEFVGGEQTEVGGGTNVKVIDGTITAPRGVPLGKYTADFCVSCESVPPKGALNITGSGSGANVNIRYCGLKISGEVVGERLRENMFPPTTRSYLFLLWYVIAIIIIIAIAFAIKKYVWKQNIKRKKR